MKPGPFNPYALKKEMSMKQIPSMTLRSTERMKQLQKQTKEKRELLFRLANTKSVYDVVGFEISHYEKKRYITRMGRF